MRSTAELLRPRWRSPRSIRSPAPSPDYSRQLLAAAYGNTTQAGDGRAALANRLRRHDTGRCRNGAGPSAPWRASPGPKAQSTARSGPCWPGWTRWAARSACGFRWPACDQCACMHHFTSGMPRAVPAHRRRCSSALGAKDGCTTLMRHATSLGHAAITRRRDWRAPPSCCNADGRHALAVTWSDLHGIELLALRAWVLSRCGERSLPLCCARAADLTPYGPAAGLRRRHPALGDWARQALPGAI